MTVLRTITLRCNRDGCKSEFYGRPDVWVDGPVRSEAGHEGWKYAGGKDICPSCVAEVTSCPIPREKA